MPHPITILHSDGMRYFMIVLEMMVCLIIAPCVFAESEITFEIQPDKFGPGIQPTMYGLFFEDINYAADGGLYAEMIKNRSFEFPDRLAGWNCMWTFKS